MDKMRNIHEFYPENLKEMDHLSIPGNRWKENIKLSRKGIGVRGCDRLIWLNTLASK
jgi:hypothetical protein